MKNQSALIKDLKALAKKHKLQLIQNCTNCGATNETGEINEDNLMFTLFRKTKT